MVITVNSGSGNLANYLLYGNNNSRDTNKISVLDGNAKLTDSISKSISADDKHFHLILSMNGKRSDDEMKEVYADFKKELLYSYSKDEVNVLSVLHQDTDNSHIHIQVPKKNLLTNTKLDLYFHKRDLKRFEMIRDYLNLKHNEAPPSIPSKADKTKNWKYNPQSIETKKEKLEFENMLLDNLFDNRDEFNSHDELMRYLKEVLKLNIKKLGYDYKKDDFYITINHTDAKKSQRIFSPLFNDGKSKYITNEDGQKEYVQYDFNTTPLEKQLQQKSQQSLDVLRTKLDKMQEVEKARIDKRLGRLKPLKVDNLNSIKENITPPTTKEVKPRPIEYNDLKKESTLENHADEFQQMEELKQINLAEIATREYNYKFIERSDEFDVIQNTDTNKKLIVYRDDDGYKYVNPYDKKERGDIVNILNKVSDKPLNETMLLLLNPLKAYLSIFKDLMKISEAFLKFAIDTYLEKDLVQSERLDSNKNINPKRTPSIKGADLKPF